MAFPNFRTEDSHHADIVLFATQDSTYLAAMKDIYDCESLVVLDTEGVELGKGGPMTLIQVQM